MGVCIRDNKIVITAEPKTFHFDLPKDASISLKHETYSIIKHNKVLTEHTIKSEIRQLLSNISIQTIFMNVENSKKSEPHKRVLNLSQRLVLKSLNKHVALPNLSTYYTWKTTR